MQYVVLVVKYWPVVPAALYLAYVVTRRQNRPDQPRDRRPGRRLRGLERRFGPFEDRRPQMIGHNISGASVLALASAGLPVVAAAPDTWRGWCSIIASIAGTAAAIAIHISSRRADAARRSELLALELRVVERLAAAATAKDQAASAP